jgi:hypothetical protein
MIRVCGVCYVPIKAGGPVCLGCTYKIQATDAHHSAVEEWTKNHMKENYPSIENWRLLSWRSRGHWTEVTVYVVAKNDSAKLSMGEHNDVGSLSWPLPKPNLPAPLSAGEVQVEIYSERKEKYFNRIDALRKIDPRDQAKMLLHTLEETVYSHEDLFHDCFEHAMKTFTDPAVVMRGDLMRLDAGSGAPRRFTPTLRIYIGETAYTLDPESDPPNIVLIPV